jgi:membrane protein HdeD
VAVNSARFGAIVTINLGVAAIVLPYFFGTFAVMMLGGVMLASGIVSLLYVIAARRQGIPVSVSAPWAQIVAGIVILIWPELALWLVAVILGGGLILSGITGLTALRDAGIVNPPMLQKIGLWSSIALGVLLIIAGAAGSAILLGVVLGVAMISAGLHQWRLADWSV